MEGNYRGKVPITTSSCVYINPNFVKRQEHSISTLTLPHLNPHFSGFYKNAPDQTLEVNPKSVSHNVHINSHHTNNLKSFITEKPKVHFNPKVLNITNMMVENQQNTCKYIIQSKNKIVKNNLVNLENGSSNSVSTPYSKPILPVIKKPSYSLIRKPNAPKHQLNIAKENILRSTACLEKSRRQQYIMCNKVWKNKINRSNQNETHNITLCHKKEVNNDRFHKVNRSLRSANCNSRSVKLNIISNVVYISGEKYIVNNNILKRVKPNAVTEHSRQNEHIDIKQKKVSRICISGITYIRKSKNLFTIDNRIKNSVRKLKKMNITCPVYRRFGVCIKHSKGKCLFLHDPKHITICSNYLKGKCENKSCRLSHEAVEEKMTTCKFYLEGCCFRENCKYLHVKVKDTAKVCLAFVQGFCADGKECDSKHIHICPDFYKFGKCSKSLCPYPHKLTENKGPKMPIYEKEGVKISSPKNSKEKFPTQTKLNICQKVSENNIDEKKQSRYFQENTLCEKDKNIDVVENPDSKNDAANSYITNRPKLGKLPSYISLE